MQKMLGRDIMYQIVLPLVLLGLSSTATAVDIIFYENSAACDGAGYSFNGISERVCCIVSASDGGSVLFTDMDSCKTSLVYKNGGCDRDSVSSGSGNLCYVGGGFTSGYWYQSCRRRSLLAVGPPQCEGKLQKPTGIIFTQGPNSSWILNSPDAVELLSDLKSLPDEDKVNWLKSKGALFNPSP